MEVVRKKICPPQHQEVTSRPQATPTWKAPPTGDNKTWRRSKRAGCDAGHGTYGASFWSASQLRRFGFISCGWRLAKSVCFLWVKVFPFYRHSLRGCRQVKMQPLMVSKRAPYSLENQGEFL
jgi:hypothetical protein